MKANTRHGAFLVVVVAIAALVVSGVVVADLGADRSRPTLAIVSSQSAAAADSLAPTEEIVDSNDPAEDPEPAPIAPASSPQAAVVALDEPTWVTEPSASVESLWSLVGEEIEDVPSTAPDPDEQGGVSDEVVANTDPAPEATTPQATAPQATAPAESETIEVEHTVSRIPDPPDVGASSKREKFLVKPDVHDPWQAVRRCESHDNYQINTGNGFYGAYQFTRSTWNWVAEQIGRPDLVGVSPHQASPADQDRMAQALAFEVPGGGLQHWPVCGRLYG